MLNPKPYLTTARLNVIILLAWLLAGLERTLYIKKNEIIQDNNMVILKKLASYLPLQFQQEIKRYYFARQIKKGTFQTDDPECFRLHEWINNGDWVLDIGANIGRYTKRMSELVGNTGWVIAFEPVSLTFEILASNTALFSLENITLMNVAVSNKSRISGMVIPNWRKGCGEPRSKDYYKSHLVEENGDISVLCITIDSLNFPYHISLVKIDVEGSELQVLQGMKNLIERDNPVFIIEGSKTTALRRQSEGYLESFGYSFERGIHNRIFTFKEANK
ncbi:hypothetical protein LCGC14_1363240 [marine sediment metagenome]|uniref:Methyltransferase FkbM domain-containing protein n=1 Tax=marine sediment metagenome TaxID=412755 RepID=A0A0F9KTJ6_9ZZZZ